jgi:hypothetical protein
LDFDQDINLICWCYKKQFSQPRIRPLFSHHPHEKRVVTNTFFCLFFLEKKKAEEIVVPTYWGVYMKSHMNHIHKLAGIVIAKGV